MYVLLGVRVTCWNTEGRGWNTDGTRKDADGTRMERGWNADGARKDADGTRNVSMYVNLRHFWDGKTPEGAPRDWWLA